MAISKSGVAQIRMGQSHGKAGGERISIAIFMSHDLTFFFVKKDLCFSLVRPASTMKMGKPKPAGSPIGPGSSAEPTVPLLLVSK